MAKELVRRDKHGRIMPANPLKDTEFRGFFNAVDRETLIEACASSEDDYCRAYASIRRDPQYANKLDIRIAEMAGVTLKRMTDCYLDYRRAIGYIELADRLPQAMADIADDALTKRIACPKCKGQGNVTVEEETLDCPDCWGTGVLTKSGDADARKVMLEAAKVTGQKGPLVAQQFNFDGGFSVEGMITQGEKMMGSK